MLLLFTDGLPAQAQSNAKTLNGKDGVQISKITPRTSAEIPLPLQRFVFHLEVQAKAVTTPTARVSVRFYRYSPSDMKLVAVAAPVDRALRGSKGDRFLVKSHPITLTDARPDERLYVKACLFDGRGRLVSYSDSFNPLRGTVVITPSAQAAQSDRIRALPGTISPNTSLKVNADAEIVVRIHYDVKSTPQGVISVELGELGDIREGKPWSVSVIEVPAGSGEIELRRTFSVTSAMQGVRLAIAVALRTDPMSGACARLELQPYPIGM